MHLIDLYSDILFLGNFSLVSISVKAKTLVFSCGVKIPRNGVTSNANFSAQFKFIPYFDPTHVCMNEFLKKVFELAL